MAHMDSDLPFADKINLSKKKLLDSFESAPKSLVLMSGGKKSLVLLDLMSSISSDPIQVLHIDTGLEFENIVPYLARLRKRFGFVLVITTPSDLALSGNQGKCPACCRDRKLSPLQRVIDEQEVDIVFSGLTNQSPEMTKTIFTNIDRCRTIHPIYHFSDNDIWDYISGHHLGYCTLYDQGYSEIDCVQCSIIRNEPEDSFTEDEESLIQQRLKTLGYF